MLTPARSSLGSSAPRLAPSNSFTSTPRSLARSAFARTSCGWIVARYAAPIGLLAAGGDEGRVHLRDPLARVAGPGAVLQRPVKLGGQRRVGRDRAAQLGVNAERTPGLAGSCSALRRRLHRGDQRLGRARLLRHLVPDLVVPVALLLFPDRQLDGAPLPHELHGDHPQKRYSERTRHQLLDVLFDPTDALEAHGSSFPQAAAARRAAFNVQHVQPSYRSQHTPPPPAPPPPPVPTDLLRGRLTIGGGGGSGSVFCNLQRDAHHAGHVLLRPRPEPDRLDHHLRFDHVVVPVEVPPPSSPSRRRSPPSSSSGRTCSSSWPGRRRTGAGSWAPPPASIVILRRS